jgi:2-haloacid dehalogenase
VATVVLDVNETLLDLAALDALFGDLLGADADRRAADLRRLWFARVLHTSAVLTLLGDWHDLGAIGRSVLEDLAEQAGVTLAADAADRLGHALRTLPAHPDVPAGLRRLADAGARRVALTNGGRATAEVQLAAAGLAPLLDDVVSVEAVRRFKPHQDVYRRCAEAAGATAGEAVLVAAHDWDCAGALRAGWRAAFVARPGQGYSRLLPPPTWRAPDVDAAARLLVESGAA